MFNDKDFMGGMFDFDGNGKTTLDEQYVAYKIYEETTKEENKENDSDSFSYKSTSYNRKPVKPTNPINVTVHKTIPEWMTLKEYKIRRKSFTTSVVISVIVATLLCMIPGVVIWAAISAYDAKNSASGFVVAIISLVALAAIIIILKEAFSSISKDYEFFQKEKAVFLKTATQEELKKHQKEKIRQRILFFSFLGVIVVIISLILIFTNSSSNNSGNDNYNSSYQRNYSYSSSSNYSSRSSTAPTKSAVSKPYSSSTSYSGYGSSGKSYSSRSKTSSKTKDEYNAKDYYHAEDFYEDHYDDFFDYEDAEDYYNDHYDD